MREGTLRSSSRKAFELRNELLELLLKRFHFRFPLFATQPRAMGYGTGHTQRRRKKGVCWRARERVWEGGGDAEMNIIPAEVARQAGREQAGAVA